MESQVINNKELKIDRIVNYLGVDKGDIVFLSSDIKRIVYEEYNRTGELPNMNILIDSFINAIGTEGTLILPTYNWDFCHGTPFDWRKTKGRTGSLGNLCLERCDFKRTKHAIYSYVVWGKYKEKLCSIDYKSSFGRNSIFGFMDRHHAKHVMLDVNFNRAFTFLHYAEEKVSNLCYRFIKDFTGEYIDENGKKTIKTYSMLVRNLLVGVKVDMTLFEQEMIDAGIAKTIILNGIPYMVVPDVHVTIPYMENDIRNNLSRKLNVVEGLDINFAK